LTFPQSKLTTKRDIDRDEVRADVIGLPSRQMRLPIRIGIEPSVRPLLVQILDPVWPDALRIELLIGRDAQGSARSSGTSNAQTRRSSSSSATSARLRKCHTANQNWRR